MLTKRHLPPLQSILRMDAATCLLMASLLLLVTGPLARMTAISADVLFWAGIALLPIGAFMASLSLAKTVPLWATPIVVVGNVLWVLASLLLPMSGVITPNGLGWAFLLAQAVVVAGFAHLEWTTVQRPAASN